MEISGEFENVGFIEAIDGATGMAYPEELVEIENNTLRVVDAVAEEVTADLSKYDVDVLDRSEITLSSSFNPSDQKI